MGLRDVEAEALQLLTGVWHWVSTELHLSDVGMCGQVLKRTLKWTLKQPLKSLVHNGRFMAGHNLENLEI